MKHKEILKRYIYILIGVMLLMGMSSCSSDSENDKEVPASKSMLQVLPLSSSFVEIHPMTRVDYLPTDYVWYEDLAGATSPEYANIGMFLTPGRTNPSADYIYLDTSDNSWKSTISVESVETYYMYGFMPRQGAQSASISALSSGNYADGAVIHLDNFNTLTPADVCVVVGVRKATDEEQSDRAPKADVKLGQFTYQGGAEGHNSAFILLKHIYSGLRFKISIDSEYHKLRTIKVTKVELEALDISEKVNLSMTLTANSTGADPLSNVTYTNVGTTTTNTTITLFPWEGSSTEFEVPETIPETFLACFAPAKCTSFILKSTYNVYDRHGNLIRSGCKAENQLNSTLLSGLNNIKAGDIFNIDLKIKPTYLYVLSEPDLDNPTIELSGN